MRIRELSALNKTAGMLPTNKSAYLTEITTTLTVPKRP